MNWVQSVLSNTNQPIPRYVLKATLLSFVPSVLILTLISLVIPLQGPEFDGNPLAHFLLIIFIAPFLETLLLWLGLWILGFLTRKILRRALLSALPWAVLHSLGAPTWGLGVFWPFVIFSLVFLYWREKSRKHAVFVTSLVHMGQNLLQGTIILLGLD